MNFDRRMIAGLALAGLVAGCTPTDATFGNAVRQSLAAQVVDPDPQYEDADHDTAATQSTAAMKRYRSDSVKQPVSIRTTDAGTPK